MTQLTKTTWPEGLIVDYAMMLASSEDAPIYNLRDLSSHWQMSIEELEALKQNSEFVRQVRSEMLVIKRGATHLQSKANMILEMWLDKLAPQWLADDSTSLSDRDKVLNSVLRVTGLLDKYKSATTESNSGGVSAPTVTINLSTPQNYVVEKVVST